LILLKSSDLVLSSARYFFSKVFPFFAVMGKPLSQDITGSHFIFIFEYTLLIFYNFFAKDLRFQR
jgi:hypothetical protein